MNTARKGRRSEHLIRDFLAADGFLVIRAAASKGPFDLVAIGAERIRLVQVKSGGAAVGSAERNVLRALRVPAICSVEIWRYRKGEAKVETVTADIEAIRKRMREDHAVLRSWSKVGELWGGINKTTAYRIALKGYTPKDPDILARLRGARSEVVVQRVTRTAKGTFGRGGN